MKGGFKLVKFMVTAVGAAAAAYGVKKAYEDDFEEVKGYVRKGRDAVCDRMGYGNDIERDVKIVDETYEYEG